MALLVVGEEHSRERIPSNRIGSSVVIPIRCRMKQQKLIHHIIFEGNYDLRTRRNVMQMT